MHQLTRVLLDMNAFNSYFFGRAIGVFFVERNLDFALTHDGVVELRNLVALRQIGVEIIFAVKARPAVDLRIDRHAGAHGLTQTFAVGHWQHARHRGVHKADMAVGFGTKAGRGAGKQLGFAGHLRMYLEANHDLPLAGVSLDAVFRHITTTLRLPP